MRDHRPHYLVLFVLLFGPAFFIQPTASQATQAAFQSETPDMFEPVTDSFDYTIDDEFEDGEDAVVEVTVSLSNGEKRWCDFATAAALSGWGWTIEGTDALFQHPNGHRVIVTSLTRDVIDRVLHYLDRHDELVESTIPLR